ncbi:hypothetical protein GCM10011390_50020 [Aureimonas endophytica]|uniref:EF-hand domain-containing protein n=1 Tax=Aureimonas endophytica TaxID=2027858 RepID=A0A917A3H8_9HYPH|nr:caspase family protein [Aureimonas endophytica]GGE24564.1 hypothetical protein GCM10011390_50020 [Aureimonas endophytica]
MGSALFWRAGLLLLALLSQPASAETRALIVGIDDYTDLRALKGATNDARDLYEVMRRRGIGDLTLLLDKDATRAGFVGAMEGLTDRVHPGDIVLVSFAGHGTSERWGKRHPDDVKEGDTYQSFLFVGFVPPSGREVSPAAVKGFGERVLGREMRVWLKRLNDKGAQVLFVADSCYSGGMTRAPARGAAAQTVRAIPAFPTPADGDDPLDETLVRLPPDTDTEFSQFKAMPNVTFLAAVDRKSLAPEFAIPPGSSTRRGALSYSVARALEGQGDMDGDGKITRDELYRFVGSNVRQISQHRQLPELQPSYGGEGSRATVFSLKDDGPSPPQTEALPVETAPRLVRIFVDGVGPDLETLPPMAGFGIRRAGTREEADYIWTPATGRVISPLGDEIATEIGEADLAGLAARELARRDLIDLSRTHPLELRLTGERPDRLYRESERVGVTADTGSRDALHYVLFNIAGNGTVQFLYPDVGRSDPTTFAGDRTPFDDINVQAPFGGDLFVLVADRLPLDPLIEAIKALDGKKAALEAVAAIRASETEGMRLATQGLFTAPRT